MDEGWCSRSGWAVPGELFSPDFGAGVGVLGVEGDIGAGEGVIAGEGDIGARGGVMARVELAGAVEVLSRGGTSGLSSVSGSPAPLLSAESAEAVDVKIASETGLV